MGWFTWLFGMSRRTDSAEPGDYNVDRWINGPISTKTQITEDTALTYSAVFACVRIISETVAVLPWHVYRREGDSREPQPDNPVDYLLSVQPNPEMTASIFRETIQAHVLTWGNGYAEIERSRGGDVVALWPIEPHKIEPKRDTSGRLYYDVDSRQGYKIQMDPMDVLHIRGLGYDGLQGYSPIRMARESVALGLDLQRFASEFFRSGTRLSGVLEVPNKMSDEAYKRLADSWKDAYAGVSKAHKTAILESGTTFKSMSVAPDEAQFLESRRFQISEIARWFQVPLHMLAELERAHFNNIEHQAREFVDRAVVPWVTRWEQEARVKLFPGETRMFTRMNMNGLLRGDAQSRSEFYKTMLQNGVYSINDVRGLEDMNDVEGGEQRFVPMNMVTLENAMNNQPREPENNPQDEPDNADT